MQNKNNNIIKKWRNANYINDEESNKLKIHNAQAPKLYGLPKLHKNNIPLRPIISYVQSPFYNLSKFLANCIKPLINGNAYYIKNSFGFKNFVDKVTLKDNFKLISLDVVSLYTNIPIDLAKNIIKDKWNNIK